ncbi:MAG: hypothetical protein JEZ06_15095 [Anaerolineaceae bacterium]|nr:hypothetical protein [Anaerolineaceae bacterium]
MEENIENRTFMQVIAEFIVAGFKTVRNLVLLILGLTISLTIIGTLLHGWTLWRFFGTEYLLVDWIKEIGVPYFSEGFKSNGAALVELIPKLVSGEVTMKPSELFMRIFLFQFE